MITTQVSTTTAYLTEVNYDRQKLTLLWRSERGEVRVNLRSDRPTRLDATVRALAVATAKTHPHLDWAPLLTCTARNKAEKLGDLLRPHIFHDQPPVATLVELESDEDGRTIKWWNVEGEATDAGKITDHRSNPHYWVRRYRRSPARDLTLPDPELVIEDDDFTDRF